MKKQCIIIPDSNANLRIDQALANLLPEYSRTLIQEWINKGLVLMNGEQVKTKTKVKSGDVILVEITPRIYPAWEAQHIPLSIVYEDDALMVINKPTGMVVHPGAGNVNATLLNAIIHHAPQLQTLPRAGILHRLDKDTSGLLLIAKTDAALKNLSHQLKKRTIVREYQAIVAGKLISGGTISAPIARHPIQRKKMAVIDTGKSAITHYRIFAKYRAHTHLTVRLETGRTHQIRVHMAHIHHPVVGDATYGKRLHLAKNMSPELINYLRQFKRQALHACALGFVHPTTQTFMRFEADLPPDMQELVNLLKKDNKGIEK